MKVLILGIDGYLGWPLALRLVADGHEVVGVDNLHTRKAVREVGSDSAIPIASPNRRLELVSELIGGAIEFHRFDITKGSLLRDLIAKSHPDAIVDFAEIRSAPYSMIDERRAYLTMSNNVVGTMRLIYAVKEIDPSIHILKMGTMGEYGTPAYNIPEAAFVQVRVNGKEDRMPVPKLAGSWYHWTKVHDSHNLLFANELWGLTITDDNQGPVFGTRTTDITDSRLSTRFDFDEAWGTVVNRYCVEAVLGLPLTPYGRGGQTRGYISLQDSITALETLLRNPPQIGELRVVNQFVELASVLQLAEYVKEASDKLGLKTSIGSFRNPRVEAERHYYNPEVKVLPKLGFRPMRSLRSEIPSMIRDLIPHKNRLKRFRNVVMPKTQWR